MTPGSFPQVASLDPHAVACPTELARSEAYETEGWRHDDTPKDLSIARGTNCIPLDSVDYPAPSVSGDRPRSMGQDDNLFVMSGTIVTVGYDGMESSGRKRYQSVQCLRLNSSEVH